MAAAQDDQHEQARVDEITARGPAGTWAVAGLATFLVVLIYFLFYFFAYLPRGAVE